jgi:hypothetical protein
MRKRSINGEPKGARAELCSLIRALAIQHLGMAVIIHFAIDVLVVASITIGSAMTTDALHDHAELERRLSFRSTPATSREPASTTAFGRRDAEKLGLGQGAGRPDE